MVKTLENLQKRKRTGGKRRRFRGRRAHESDGYPLEPIVGAMKSKPKRRRGGKVSFGLASTDSANVYDFSQGKVMKTKIIRVKSSPANRDYERRGVITRGAVIETEIGDARVTSRPAQDGVVNAILLK